MKEALYHLDTPEKHHGHTNELTHDEIKSTDQKYQHDKVDHHHHHHHHHGPRLTRLGRVLSEKIFERYDKDQDGVLSIGEMNALLRDLQQRCMRSKDEYADMLQAE